MKRAKTWWLRVSGIVLLIIGFVLFLEGPQYEVSKIPPATRVHMADTDWIGVEWIGAGIVLMLVGAGGLASAYFVDRRRRLTETDN